MRNKILLEAIGECFVTFDKSEPSTTNGHRIPNGNLMYWHRELFNVAKIYGGKLKEIKPDIDKYKYLQWI